MEAKKPEISEADEKRRQSCILKRIRCPDDPCYKCGWNKDVASRRIKAIRKGKMLPDENGLTRLRLRDGLPINKRGEDNEKI